MATIHDFAELIASKHGPVELDKLHKLLFYVNLYSLRDTGKLAFPDHAVALPSGPVFPVVDVHLGHDKWRRRFEARYGTRGRRGARRIQSMRSILANCAKMTQ